MTSGLFYFGKCDRGCHYVLGCPAHIQSGNGPYRIGPLCRLALAASFALSSLIAMVRASSFGASFCSFPSPTNGTPAASVRRTVRFFTMYQPSATLPVGLRSLGLDTVA